MDDPRPLPQPSPWVTRFAPLIPEALPVLDLACGRGRHTQYLASRGHRVIALDRNNEVLQPLNNLPNIETIETDLENEGAWPLADRQFAGIIVTNYLYRPLFPTIVEAVAENGVLIYETFALGNEAFGKPSNPDFLLRPGELLEMVQGSLRVVCFEEGEVALPRPAIMQRICAVKSSTAPTLPQI